MTHGYAINPRKDAYKEGLSALTGAGAASSCQ
jgi:hypothetical protein